MPLLPEAVRERHGCGSAAALTLGDGSSRVRRSVSAARAWSRRDGRAVCLLRLPDVSALTRLLAFFRSHEWYSRDGDRDA